MKKYLMKILVAIILIMMVGSSLSVVEAMNEECDDRKIWSCKVWWHTMIEADKEYLKHWHGKCTCSKLRIDKIRICDKKRGEAYSKYAENEERYFGARCQDCYVGVEGKK